MEESFEAEKRNLATNGSGTHLEAVGQGGTPRAVQAHRPILHGHLFHLCQFSAVHGH